MGTVREYISRPKVIQACQWNKAGDYPVDGVVSHIDYTKICLGTGPCKHCDQSWVNHGGMNTHEGYHIVCPGDYICTGIEGEMYPCKPSIFEKSYEELADEDPNDPQNIMRKNLESWRR